MIYYANDGVVDDWRGKICCLPNLILRYGWNPGSRLEGWFQKKLSEGPYLSQDNRKFDLTFREVTLTRLI